MPEWVKAWWASLTTTQRTIVIVAASIVVIGGLGMILGSYIFAGTDYSGFGDWLQGWL